MNNIKEIAEKHLDTKLKDLGVNIPNYRHIAINIILGFGKEVLDLNNKDNESFRQSFIKDFETDFVLNGEIVDNPDNKWSCLTRLYKEAKNIG